MKKLTALLLAVALLLTMTACVQEKSDTPTTAPSGPTDPSSPTTPEELGEVYKIDSYTAKAEDAVANRDTVVATLNGIKLPNGTLQLYYWLNVYDFISNYDVESCGLDLTKPLTEQKCGDNGTWEHYFLGSALANWNYHQALALMAQEEGVVLNAYFQRLLDGMERELAQSAVDGGYDTIEAMIQHDVGPGCNAEDYYRHLRILYAAQNYCYSKVNAMNFTDQQIEAYFTEHEAALAVDGITKALGVSHKVRHILLQIKENATDDDWEKLRVEAQALLDQWLAGEATEESFSALAVEKSEDPGSCSYGGLYRGLTESTSFLQPFKDWYLEEGRQVGDYGLVKTTAGYHIMYYSGMEPIWYYYCREMMVSDEMEKVENTAMEKYEVVVHYDKILLGQVSLVEDE